MTWLRGALGVICVLVGLVWIGQGLNFIPGSFMTGQVQWAILGLVLLAFGAWLLWGLAQRRRA
ncbi:MAG TPA: hypothetical protein VGL99_05970 [Chloroflexota bacterium]